MYTKVGPTKRESFECKELWRSEGIARAKETLELVHDTQNFTFIHLGGAKSIQLGRRVLAGSGAMLTK